MHPPGLRKLTLHGIIVLIGFLAIVATVSLMLVSTAESTPALQTNPNYWVEVNSVMIPALEKAFGVKLQAGIVSDSFPSVEHNRADGTIEVSVRYSETYQGSISDTVLFKLYRARNGEETLKAGLEKAIVSLGGTVNASDQTYSWLSPIGFQGIPIGGLTAKGSIHGWFGPGIAVFLTLDEAPLESTVKNFSLEFQLAESAPSKVVDPLIPPVDARIGVLTGDTIQFNANVETADGEALSNDQYVWSGTTSGVGSAISVKFEKPGEHMQSVTLRDVSRTAKATVWELPPGPSALDWKHYDLILMEVYGALTVTTIAWQAREFEGDTYRADAARHAYWSCTLANTFGSGLAQELTNIHERDNLLNDGHGHNDIVMDLVNNKSGRDLANPLNKFVNGVIADLITNNADGDLSELFIASAVAQTILNDCNDQVKEALIAGQLTIIDGPRNNATALLVPSDYERP